MYEEFWGLKEKPFENSPDPRYLFPADEHQSALETLGYAVYERKGGALLTGDYGCGKTLLIRVLVRRLIDDGVEAAVVSYPRLTALEFLREILYQLGVEERTRSRQKLSRMVAEILHDNVMDGKHTIVVVDEAQVVNRQAILDELRLLLNYQFNDRFLLTLILVGQPELRERIAALPQLEQRLALRVHLHNLDPDETRKYISHRLVTAGATRPIFTDAAIETIYEHTYGCPRRINNMADLCLWRGFQRKRPQVDPELVQAVA